MSITDPIFQKANFYPEKYGRETFLADAGQRSRAIIPGDDPGDQQPPERRGLYPDPDAVRLTLARSASDQQVLSMNVEAKRPRSVAVIDVPFAA